MRAIDVNINSLDLFRVCVSGDVASLVDQQAFFAGLRQFMCDDGAKEPGAHNQVIVSHSRFLSFVRFRPPPSGPSGRRGCART